MSARMYFQHWYNFHRRDDIPQKFIASVTFDFGSISTKNVHESYVRVSVWAARACSTQGQPSAILTLSLVATLAQQSLVDCPSHPSNLQVCIYFAIVNRSIYFGTYGAVVMLTVRVSRFGSIEGP